ncbi:MAG: hypothetical protein ABSF95_20375 [Verrucomicrobiota bacterium]|jgi:hypothetical protein
MGAGKGGGPPPRARAQPSSLQPPASSLHGFRPRPEAGNQVASLTSAPLLTAQLPPSPEDTLELELRCQGWVPKQTTPGSNDPRTLGIQVSRITMRARGSGTNTFNANTGEWLNR